VPLVGQLPEEPVVVDPPPPVVADPPPPVVEPPPPVVVEPPPVVVEPPPVAVEPPVVVVPVPPVVVPVPAVTPPPPLRTASAACLRVCESRRAPHAASASPKITARATTRILRVTVSSDSTATDAGTSRGDADVTPTL
jgi:hypothetical protein